jgi:uncharacterized membrane protein YccC
VPEEFHFGSEQDEPSRWIVDPTRLLRLCDETVRRLVGLPARTPSLRLLADQTAEVLGGLSRALDGLALLVDDPARPPDRRRGRRRLRLPDLLPPLVNAGRAFVVIGVADLFWVVTAWPGGANAITFASIIVILFAPRADQAYAIAIGFIIGSVLTVIIVATLLFATLPNVETFAAFSLIIGLVLVPVGTCFALQWQPAIFTGMITVFVPLLAPTNPMSYDPQQYYNTALTIIVGAGTAALSFRLLPPLSPGFRARRLMALSLRDLRRLMTGAIPRTPDDWQDRIYGRLAVLPEAAEPVQRSQLVAALSVGTEIIQLRHIARRLGLDAELDGPLASLARGRSAIAAARFAQLDRRFASLAGAEAAARAALRARGSILAISEALNQHAAYFDAGASG